MTLSLAAVFIPILFMAGILGRLFREFAVTICTAILISGMVSISLTPMLCSRFLRAGTAPKSGHGLLYRAMEGAVRFHPAHLQRHACTGCCATARVMLAAFLVVLGVTGYLYVDRSQGLHSGYRQRQLQRQTEAAQGTSYYQMVQVSAAGCQHHGAGSGCGQLQFVHAAAAIRRRG